MTGFVATQSTPSIRSVGKIVDVRHWPTGLRWYVSAHLLWLLMYAVLGKGFAYAGLAPIFVGELLLTGAFVSALSSGRIGALVRTPLGSTLGVFMCWQLVCSLPYLSVYGVETLRDSVVWGYAIFAWSIAACVLRLRGFITLSVIPNYRRFVGLYLILGPASVVATLFLKDWLPIWPGTAVTIPAVKVGEYCVHLAGVLAFSLVGMAGRGPWLLLVVIDSVLAFGGRGGLLALLVSCAFVMLLRPKVSHLLTVVTFGLIVLSAMATFELRFVIPGTAREFSLSQLEDSMASLVGASPREDLEGTKKWRLDWWAKIFGYTFEGEYFWQGKGYGVNLADSDGFQVGTREDPLRSPHNSHLTFLARSGVPGFLLWLTVQGVWAWSMWRAQRASCLLRAHEWSSLFIWLLAYWLAFMVSAAFDVFLEGPMAGIPFWSLFGLGWGAHTLFHSQLSGRRGRLA